MSVRATSNPTRARSRARIVTRPSWSVSVNGRPSESAKSGSSEGEPFARVYERSCSNWLWIVKWQNTKHMLNNCTLKENRTWLLVRTWHCYFIPFNDEHPVDGVDHNRLTPRSLNNCCCSYCFTLDAVYCNAILWRSWMPDLPSKNGLLSFWFRLANDKIDKIDSVATRPGLKGPSHVWKSCQMYVSVRVCVTLLGTRTRLHMCTGQWTLDSVTADTRYVRRS